MKHQSLFLTTAAVVVAAFTPHAIERLKRLRSGPAATTAPLPDDLAFTGFTAPARALLPTPAPANGPTAPSITSFVTRWATTRAVFQPVARRTDSRNDGDVTLNVMNPMAAALRASRAPPVIAAAALPAGPKAAAAAAAAASAAAFLQLIAKRITNRVAKVGSFSFQ